VSFDNIYDWIVYLLPNLRHLKSDCTLFDVVLPKLRLILNERIRQLDINSFSSLTQLTQISYVLFSNVEYINLCLSAFGTESEWWCTDALMKIFQKFKNLKSLLICTQRTISAHIYPLYEGKLNLLIKRLNMDAIMKDYQVKYFREHCLFLCANNRSSLTDYTVT
jgi:hypothetical protein